MLAAVAGCKKEGDGAAANAPANPPAPAGNAAPIAVSPAATPGAAAGTAELTALVSQANGYTDLAAGDDGQPVLRIAFRSPGIDDATLQKLATPLRKSPTRVNLGLSGGGITDAGMAQLKGMDSLLSLGISDTKISDEGLKPLADLAHLEALSISSDKITDAGIAHLAKLTNLKRLSVYAKNLTAAAYAAVKDMTRLEELQLGGFSSHVGDAQLANMKNLVHLKELKLDGNDLTDAGMANIKDMADVRKLWLEAPKVTKTGAANLAGLKSLEELTVMKCPGLDDDGLSVMKDLKKLKVLDLVYGDPITAKGSAALGSLTSLRKLRLGKVGPDGLQGLKSLGDLEELDLNYSRVDDANLAHLSGLKKLKKLNLQSTPVTDAGMKHLAGLTGLRELWLNDDAITDEGLKAIAGLSGLEQLYMSSCKVTGSAFKDLKSMTGLKELHISGNPIAEENAAALKDIPALKEVDLTGTKVSEDAALELKQAKPALRVRDVTGNDVSLTPPPARQRPPQEDLTSAKPDFSLSAEDFMKEFKASESDARKKYKGKVIELSGEVTGIGRNISGEDSISLKAPDLLGMMCFTAMEEPWTKAVPGQKVKLKGKLGEYGAVLIYCVFTDPGKYAGVEMTAAELAKEYAADPDATSKKYNDKYLILSGEVEKKEYNSAGAVSVYLKAPESKVRVAVSFTAFEKELSRKIKPGKPLKVIGQYSLNFGKDEVKLLMCLPITQK